MAATVLISFAESIASKMGSLTFPYIQIMFCLNFEKEKFMSTLSAIKAVLLDAESQEQKSHIDEVWLEKLQDVLYDAEDLVDELSTAALRQQAEAQNNLWDKVLNFFSVVPFYVTVAIRMKSIRDRLKGVAECRIDFPGVGLHDQKKAMDDTYSYVSRSKIVGREADTRAMIKFLIDSSSEENVSVIPIVGIGGLGKTALAQLVYNDEKVEKHFEVRLWACISDNFELKVIVKKILESALNKEPGNLLMNTLQDQLRSRIEGKRYLLVLDNVWNENYQKWIDLKDLLMGGSRGSKIIVTTRSEMVARTTGGFPYVLGSLSEHESWSLFTRMAFVQGPEPKEKIAIGKEIVRKCAGVPLAIRTIGSLLRYRTSESDWLLFKNNNILQLGQKENDILPILKLSYIHLPTHLKKCFTYCSLFPKDYEIDKETLINLWMAQGFLQPSHGNTCLEDIGQQYFMDLLLRSFFQDEESDEWGNVIKCKMHDLMLDLSKSVVGIECVSNLQAENIDERTHHLSVDHNFSPEHESYIPFHKLEKIRTFLLPVQEQNLVGVSKSVGNGIFSRLTRLRVLDMHNLNMETVSDLVVELKHLRYLDLSGNRNIKKLPDSITSLQNLQTLKLNNCWKLRELPRDTRKLVRLRHLEINKTNSLNHMPCGLGTLISLHTLTRFAVGKNSSAVRHGIGLRRKITDRAEKLLLTPQPCAGLGELYGLNNLRGELMIKNLQNVAINAASESNAANLREKQYLQSLILQWGRRENVSQDLERLEGLQPHQNLKQLSIYGYGAVRFPKWMDNMNSCLPNISKITISDCKILSGRLPSLGQLPSLTSLHLYNFPVLEYIDLEFAEPAPRLHFFPALKELKLVSLTNLEGWWRHRCQHSQRPYFHCLSKIHIRNCPILTSIPLVPCIEEVDLRNVSEELLRLTMTKATAAEASTSSAAPLFPSHSGLKSLRIEEINNLESLPVEQIQELTSIKQLEILSCPTLMRLPEECISGLTHLQMLTIQGCDRLMYLPTGIQHLTALRQLTVDHCLHLKERIHEDWHKIARIPRIQMDGKWIQRKE